MLKKLLLITSLLFVGCNNPQATYISEHKEIHAAMKMLWRDNPESLQILKDTHAKGIHLRVSMGELPHAELATTTVTLDSATIVIDVKKIDEDRDNVVPVLAHEIYHVRDAFLIMGIESFVATANREKEVIWEYKTLEVMAVKAEDDLRQKLLKMHPQDYKGMASSRREANRRAERFQPFIH